MGRITDSVFKQIDRGMEGLNVGLPMGLPKIEGLVDGVTRETYSLLFGSTGSGKTSFALYAYIYKPIMDNFDSDDFKIIYYSLEMSAEALFIKLASIYLWEKHRKVLSFKEILSKRRGYKLSKEDYELLLTIRPWLERLEEIITVYDRGLNADRLYAHLSEEMKKYGEYIPSEDGNRLFYIPHNPNLTTLVVIDHIGLVKKTNGRTKKEEIDLLSNYLVTFKNRCKVSPLVIMQMNRGASSMDRRKGGYQEPQLDDIKDSGGPSEDAEIVLSVFHPHREKMTSYHGYDIATMQNRFRAIVCLKNRYGETDKSVGCAFYGEAGIWNELPKSEEINDYDKFADLVKKEIIPTKQDNVKKVKMEFTL